MQIHCHLPLVCVVVAALVVVANIVVDNVVVVNVVAVNVAIVVVLSVVVKRKAREILTQPSFKSLISAIEIWN